MQDNVTEWIKRDRSGPWWERTLSGAVALIIGLGALWLLHLLVWPLALLVGVVALAAAFSPLVQRLSQWMPRTAAIILLYLLLLALFILIGLLVAPRIWSEAQTALEEAPRLAAQWQERVDDWLPGGRFSVSTLIERLLSGTGLGNALQQSSRLMARLTTAFVVIIFGSLYALIDAPRFHRFVLSLFPADRQAEVDDVLGEVTGAMGGFVRGELMAALIIGALTYIALLVLGFPYAIVLAVVAGLLEFIPLVGPFVTAVVLVLVGLSQSVNQALIALVLSIIIQQIESNIVLPNVMRQEANISPLLVLLSILGGERIGGLVGALIAIPLVAGLRVVVIRVIAPAIRRWSGAEPVEESAGEGDAES